MTDLIMKPRLQKGSSFKLDNYFEKKKAESLRRTEQRDGEEEEVTGAVVTKVQGQRETVGLRSTIFRNYLDSLRCEKNLCGGRLAGGPLTAKWFEVLEEGNIAICSESWLYQIKHSDKDGY
ncbi:PREDICTED: uncharacterized protein LOC104771324 isoform X4 [Camelina sativa]|uniref:Uncharacterized protein LOC104771324 isoform X4 n=1 Tax=Camelina sativa TaxID=90675 RepID=A0ABM1RDV7_CAMSA|nr:PREDICTED: uncharacterized protein LOC104771324 isoform X4 [Camelina sativa]